MVFSWWFRNDDIIWTNSKLFNDFLENSSFPQGHIQFYIGNAQNLTFGDESADFIDSSNISHIHRACSERTKWPFKTPEVSIWNITIHLSICKVVYFLGLIANISIKSIYNLCIYSKKNTLASKVSCSLRKILMLHNYILMWQECNNYRVIVLYWSRTLAA